MLFAHGARFGPYEIVASLGAGGMGEVYRAHDTTLNRDVAIKVLLPDVANDPDRLARFSREAQVLASLNHPNIAHIHGIEDADGVKALALEFVDGEDLAHRIARGPLLLDEALPIAKQIAEALEAAHEQGIVHRDLKPANIRVRRDGIVKVLDFGLAKAVEPVISTMSSRRVSESPTLTTPAMTRAGLILGTAAYMSPEQAKGRGADKRSDVWAFGCVLYEMLTGGRAFRGEDVTETLASVLAREPDLRALPADLPAPVVALVHGCLQKDPRARIPDMSMVRYVIDRASAPATIISGAPVDRPVRRRSVSIPTMGAAVVVAAVVGAAAAGWLSTPSRVVSTPGAVRFSIIPTPPASFVQRGNDRDLAISPDGKSIAFRGLLNGEFVMFVRSIDALEPVALRGLSVGPRHPFFSPDGRWIGFFSTTALWKVAVTGGPALKVSDISGAPRGATWLADNTIVFASTAAASGLQRVSASGGTPQTLTTPNRQAGEIAHLWPSALPDGRGVLFTIRMPGPVDSSFIGVFDLKANRTSVLVRGGTSPMYAPSKHLVYAVGGGLRAVPFDLSRLQVTGDAVPVLDQVGVSAFGAGEFDIAQSGTLLYAAAGSGSARSLVLVGRDGSEEPVKAPPRAYNYPRLSPDGTRIAVDILDQDSDIWVWDNARETLTRVTSDPAVDSNPVWMPDGRRIVFASTRDGVANMFVQRAEGGVDPEPLVKSGDSEFPYAVTPDGTTLIFRRDRPLTTHEDIDVLTLADRTGRTLIATPSSEGNADLSPDGRWLAFQSTDSGRDEVYVRPFPDVGSGRWQVSTGGGNQPLWSKDGRELFYRDNAGGVIGLPVTVAGGTFSPGRAAAIIARPYFIGPGSRTYDITRDGRRFLLVRESGQDSTSKSAMIVVLNWIEELKSRVR